MKKTSSNQHLIVISLDALNFYDFDYIKNLSNFKPFIKEGAYAKEVSSMYPSVTYACHTSIITGTYPNKHGIYANVHYNASNPQIEDWYWFKKNIKVPTLFDYAKEAGLTTGSALWPVMTGASIDSLCPAIWSTKGESYVSLYSKYASKELLPTILTHITKGNILKEPNLDNFTEEIAKEIIVTKKPNLLCVHLLALDFERHINGLHSDNVKDVLDTLNKRIGNIIDTTKEVGIYDNTTFVLLGDHGGNDFENVVFLNSLFLEKKLLKVDEKNSLISWKAYANTCGGSVQIHINENTSELDKKEIKNLLEELTTRPDSFVKKMYTKKEVNKKYNLSGDFTYVLEAKDGYSFGNDITDKLVKSRKDIKNCYHAEHGYEPTHKNLRTLFFAKGNKIKKGVFIDKASLVDEGPTFAKILNLKMENVDGRVLEEILL